MTTPPSFPVLRGQAWSVHKRPTFSTRVASHVSAREVRAALYAHALYEFEVSYDGLASSAQPAFAGLGSLQTLLGFFMACQGQFGTFLYTDPSDNAASGQALGTGDGATTAFTFARAIGGYVETVGWVTSVAAVYLNGVLQPAAAWTLNQPNTLSFGSAPPAGAAVSADFAYAFVCRFLDDQQDFENVMAGLWQLQSLKFRCGNAMRAASPALVAALAALRAQPDAAALMADCYTFTLRTGTILTYTNVDVPVALNGFVYAANSILVDGLQYKCATGLEVDKQKITIMARPSDTIGGIPFLVAMRNGLFDGCFIQRERAFLASWGVSPIGSVVLFKGRVSTIDSVGRTTAQITVASDLVLLDIDMPRNLYQPTCNHVLFDSGCGLVKNAFGAAGTVGAGATATATMIPWPGASAAYAQGTITFTSGADTGASATIKTATAGALTLAYPLPQVPAAGDGFTAYQGCDHTLATCKAKFANAANFRGFPFVPVPETAF